MAKDDKNIQVQTAQDAQAEQVDTEKLQRVIAEQLQTISELNGRVAELTTELDNLKRANADLQKQIAVPKTAVAMTRGTHIRVAALSNGYFRGGVQFSQVPQELEIAKLSKEQLAAIRGDDRLVVVDL